MERIDLMHQAIENAYETMKKNPADSDKHKEAAETFKYLCKLAVEEKKNDYDEFFNEQKLEADTKIRMKEIDVKLKELNLKEDQYNNEKKNRWLPKGDTIFICIAIGALTTGTYIVEGKGILTPKALTHVKTLFRFV